VSDLAVVHLVRRQNGLPPFERFLRSYREHAAGAPHDLVILFKGFPVQGGTQDYDRVLDDLPHRRLYVSDRGLDLNAYFESVASLQHEHFCFFNSYSRILDDGWLGKLFRWIREEGVGLVGATGSWQSIARPHSMLQEGRHAMPSMARLRSRIALALRDRRPGALARRAGLWGLRLAGIWRPARHIPAFPNYHVRTNAFMVARRTLDRIRFRPLRWKLSAYKFESGNDSLTNQVLRLGLKVLVVGRDGEGYPPERWHRSNTFWQSNQENLLVADNQTEAYIAADPAGRAVLSGYAWGELARPG
jgi:hypothetical protein